jgi:hypothetical protein
VSIGQLPYPEQITFPPIDQAAVTPSVDEVALLCATRTIDESGTQLGTFTSDTNPTDVQCEGLIAQAVTMVLTPLPDYLQQSLYGRIQQAVALQAAILVETSFYREQANAGSIVAMTTSLRLMLGAIQEDAGGAGVSNRVDSIVVRSTMADYDPYYPMPPPPVVGGGSSAWLQPQPPTGPPQLDAISPAGWSKGNQSSVIVTVSGLNLQALPDLSAYLQDSAGGQLIAIPPVIDPSGQGTMLVATFSAPPPDVALGPGWFYLLLSGASYGPLMPWEWVA